MEQVEGNIIAQVNIEEVAQVNEKYKKIQSIYMWRNGFTSYQDTHTHTHIFKDTHSFYRNATMPLNNDNKFFWYLYNNIFENPPICNSWKKNWLN